MTHESDTSKFLRNAWYIAALSEEVDENLLARRIIGEPIVMYRCADGSCAALEDRCCHRGVPLHLGSIKSDCVQCAYHGFTFDRSGKCIRVPSQKSIPASAAVRSYAIIERYGFLWIWMGDQPSDPSAMMDLSEIEGPDWSGPQGVIPVAADYRRVVDNTLDLSHVAFVHRSTFGSDDEEAELTFVEKDGRVEGVRSPPPMPTPPMYARLGFSTHIQQVKRMIYEPPCTVKAPITTRNFMDGKPQDSDTGPTAMVYIFNSITPETETTAHYFWVSARNFDTDNPETTEFIRQQTLLAFQEDKTLIEAEQKSHDEGFGPGTGVRADMGGAMARRLLARLIDREKGSARTNAEAVLETQ